MDSQHLFGARRDTKPCQVLWPVRIFKGWSGVADWDAGWRGVGVNL